MHDDIIQPFKFTCIHHKALRRVRGVQYVRTAHINVLQPARKTKTGLPPTLQTASPLLLQIYTYPARLPCIRRPSHQTPDDKRKHDITFPNPHLRHQTRRRQLHRARHLRPVHPHTRLQTTFPRPVFPLETTPPRSPHTNRKTATMKVTINSAQLVATWKWALPANSDDTCGICRVDFEGTCSKCKFPGDECPVVVGGCTHCFHMVR